MNEMIAKWQEYLPSLVINCSNSWYSPNMTIIRIEWFETEPNIYQVLSTIADRMTEVAVDLKASRKRQRSLPNGLTHKTWSLKFKLEQTNSQVKI